MSKLVPIVNWAEVNDSVLMTVDVSEPKDLVVDLKEDSIDFAAKSGEKNYGFHLDFKNKIDVNKSSYTTDRLVQFKLVKQEHERWNNLTKSKVPFVKVDWNRWVDSDDEGEKGFDDFDMGGMGGMGGLGGMMGGMGGMGGMPGMGMPGMPGMGDMSSLLSGMGGMGGMGGLEGMMGGMGGMDGDMGEDSDDEHHDVPALQPTN